jgi:hypothetical protein
MGLKIDGFQTIYYPRVTERAVKFLEECGSPREIGTSVSLIIRLEERLCEVLWVVPCETVSGSKMHCIIPWLSRLRRDQPVIPRKLLRKRH